MVSLCFCEVSGLGLELFDAGVQAVENMRFLVNARHGDGSIGGSRWRIRLDAGVMNRESQ